MKSEKEIRDELEIVRKYPRNNGLKEMAVETLEWVLEDSENHD